MSSTTLAIIVPCYNEEEVLHETAKRMKAQLLNLIKKGKISSSSYICFVDDGSRDKTWEIISYLHNSDPLFKGLKLASNKGHQHALLGGLEFAQTRSDVTISIDADLQDDIEVFEEFIDRYHEGHDVVYGVRNKRELDTFFKKWTALFFYKLMLWMGVKIVYNHADYRLASSRALAGLKEYREVNLFLRGIFPSIGYKSTTVTYDRHERFAGESKYPLTKMLSFAIDGITSFSVVPLRLVTFSGFIAFFITCLLVIWALVQNLRGEVIPGWSSTIVSIYLIGAIQLISVGLIGEYIGKIYREVKARPRYILEQELF
ncbi:MAG: glycosyltransferase family 2 protein [Bacteriovoracaceae bacterium]|nr:glycosyltransferase family 2 protein [Bacteriovoracaceae bacterium]